MGLDPSAGATMGQIDQNLHTFKHDIVGLPAFHVRNEAGNLAEHARRLRPCFRDKLSAGEVAEMRPGRDRGEAVALDREAENGDARAGDWHGWGAGW